VRLSCDGFEEELLALFAAIEASNFEQGSGSCSNLGEKDIRELRTLSCSINYDANSDSVWRDRNKGRVASGFFMKPKLLSWNVRGLNEGDKRLRVRNLLR
jgi:hypothetical protein